MSVLIIAGLASVVLGVGLAGMIAGVYLRGKPIRHCAGSAAEFDGETMECPACGARETCKRRKSKLARD